jgi:hypothetical protein
VVQFTCTSAPIDVIEEVSSALTSSLQFEASPGQYKYTWKTAKGYAGNCYQLQLQLVDGTTYAANFKFK